MRVVRRRFLRWQRGFTYLVVLGLLAALAIGLSTAAPVWTTAVQRDREAELQHVGLAYALAIERYHDVSGSGRGSLPGSIGELLSDDRFKPPLHHLRQAYGDPMVPGQALALVMDPAGGIVGVRSLSQEPPLRTTTWGDERHAVAAGRRLCDIIFLANLGHS